MAEGTDEVGKLDLELYREYRAYVVHEDGLLNNRMNWFIQLHSFLIASYALTLNAMVMTFFPSGTGPGKSWIIQIAIAIVSIGIAGIGFCSAHVASKSILVSRTALRNIRNRWDRLKKKGIAPSDERVPPLTYAGRQPRIEKRHLERDLPDLMKLLWLFSVVISITLGLVGFFGVVR